MIRVSMGLLAEVELIAKKGVRTLKMQTYIDIKRNAMIC